MKILFRILDGCGGLLDRLSGIGIVRGPAFSDKTLLDVKNAFSAGDWRPAANALRAAEGRWQQRGRLFSTIRSAKKPWMAAKSWHETDPNDVDSTLTYGKTLLDWAWHARGGGYANTVSNKAIELFGERLTEALPLLNSAAQAAPNDPAAFDCLMWIGTALGAPRRQVEAWFAEATSRDPWNLAVRCCA